MLPKGKKIEIEQDTEEWHSWRRNGIGASESAVIYMEENYPYSDNIQKLWSKKSGRLESEFIDNDAVRRGKKLEPVARDLFRAKTGIAVTPMCYEHHIHSYIKASMDGISDNGETIVEIKCPSRPERHQTALEGHIHEEYYIQMQHQFLVTGARIGYFVSYFPEYSRNPQDDLVVILVKPKYSKIQEILRKINKFWSYVERGVMPVENALTEDSIESGKVGLVMISGYAKAGKDTLTEAYQRVLKAQRFAFADKLKEVYCEVVGITMEEMTANKEAHRDGLVGLGKGLRKVYPDVWLKGVFNKDSGIYESMSTYGAVISDERYLNEYTYGFLEAGEREVPFLSIWIDSSQRGIAPANEEEEKTTFLLSKVSNVVVRNDIQLTDANQLAMAMDRVILKIYNGFKDIKLSGIISEIESELPMDLKKKATRGAKNGK